jgi:mannose-6-phosphate isomerase-like protein (cupin superfamily)
VTAPTGAIDSIEGIEIVVPCGDANFDDTLAFCTNELSMRVATIFPADRPRVAVVFGHGTRLRLDATAHANPGTIVVRSNDLAPEARVTLTAPNGTRIEIVHPDPPMVVPPLVPALVVSRARDDTGWHAGRAGMRYRDLIPDRLGGRFIASHIAIPDGGPVPDYVHFHKIRFQMIFCHRGWVKVVYEDQGEPFILQAGDCVLQPPSIRHRVLEASPGLHVVEIGCPAEHETHADPVLSLPNDVVRPERSFSGQRFVRHVAADAVWSAWRQPGLEFRDTGIGAATAGLAGARVVRPAGDIEPVRSVHRGELLFLMVLDGGVAMELGESEPLELDAGDSVVIPGGMPHTVVRMMPGSEMLEVTLPGSLPSDSAPGVQQRHRDIDHPGA